MNWNLLGISPTIDKKEITNAYRQKLKTVNPEDKPEEFMALRAAYDEALKLAKEAALKEDGDSEEETEKKKTPVQLWTEELEKTYYDYQKRISINEWKRLLSEDICVAIDTRLDAEAALLGFLMSHYHLPQKIWIYLDGEFSFKTRKDELCEKYPKQFIERAVIAGVDFEQNMPAEMFEPGINGEDVDRYIALCYEAGLLPDEEKGAKYEEIHTLSEKHPYGEMAEYAYLIRRGQRDVLEKVEQLKEKYPDDRRIQLDLASEYYVCEEYEKGEKLAREVYNRDCNIYAGIVAARCIGARGNYYDALELLNELLTVSDEPSLHYAIAEERTVFDNKLIEEYEKVLQENPDNSEIRFRLAWSYVDVNRMQDAYRTAITINEAEIKKFEYNNLMAVIYGDAGDYERSIECTKKTIEALEVMQPDGTRRTEYRMKRIPEMHTRIAAVYYMQKRYEEAEKEYNLVYDEICCNQNLIGGFVQFCLRTVKYEKAEAAIREFIRNMPYSYLGHMLLGIVLFRQHKDSEALEELDCAIDLDMHDITMYLYKLRLFIRNKAYEAAHGLLDYLDEQHAEEDKILPWCRAWLVKDEENDSEKALAMYQKLEEGLSEDTPEEFWLAEFYQQYANLYATVNDKAGKDVSDEILSLLNKGLVADPDSFDLNDYKAWLLLKHDKVEEALAVYLKLEKYPRSNLYIERQLAECYYRRIELYADKGYEYFLRILSSDIEETNQLQYRIGRCALLLGKCKEAEKHFLREIELYQDDYDGYVSLTETYLALDNPEKALENIEKAIELIKKENDPEQVKQEYKYCYSRKMDILRRLRRPQSAIGVVDFMASKNLISSKYDYYHVIYLQFGEFEVDKELEKLRKSLKGAENPRYLIKHLRLERQFLSGENNHSFLSLFGAGNDNSDVDDTLFVYINLAKGKYQEAEQALNKVLKLSDLGDGNRSKMILLRLLMLRMLNDSETAKKEANELLEKECGFIFTGNYRILSAKKAFLYAMADDNAEALKQLEKLEKLPRCINCKKSKCIHGMLVRAIIAAFLGDYGQAKIILEDIQRTDHSVRECVVLLNYVKRKLDK